MPNVEWRRAYRFGYLVSALYNYRLLDVVIHYVQRTLAVDLRLWVDAILDDMAEESDGGVMGELDAIFSRYIDAIMRGGGLVLEWPGEDTHLWAVGDAVLALVLRRRQEFFDAVRRITHDVLDDLDVRQPPGSGALDAPLSRALIDELFVFQDLLVPGFDRRRPAQATFSRDWLHYRRRMGDEGTLSPWPVPGGVTLVHTPPPHALQAGGWPEFLKRQLAALHARTPMDCVTVPSSEMGNPSIPET